MVGKRQGVIFFAQAEIYFCFLLLFFFVKAFDNQEIVRANGFNDKLWFKYLKVSNHYLSLGLTRRIFRVLTKHPRVKTEYHPT